MHAGKREQRDRDEQQRGGERRRKASRSQVLLEGDVAHHDEHGRRQQAGTEHAKTERRGRHHEHSCTRDDKNSCDRTPKLSYVLMKEKCGRRALTSAARSPQRNAKGQPASRCSCFASGWPWLGNVLMRHLPTSAHLLEAKRCTNQVFERPSVRQCAAAQYEAMRKGDIDSGGNDEVLQRELTFPLRTWLPLAPTLAVFNSAFVLHRGQDVIDEYIVSVVRQDRIQLTRLSRSSPMFQQLANQGFVRDVGRKICHMSRIELWGAGRRPTARKCLCDSSRVRDLDGHARGSLPRAA